MFKEAFKNNPLILYEFLLLNPLSIVYSEKKKTNLDGWQSYSDLLIDKFAIHSSSFIHLSQGIIEHKKSGTDIKVHGYDLFTVNSTFRTIMETYATFNHIFVEPETIEEKKFRFILWKIDGLNEKKKFLVNETDFEEAKQILDNDKIIFEQAISELESCEFYKNIQPEQSAKIIDIKKRKFKWRFIFFENKITPITITDLIAKVYRTRDFINLYKHTSIHIHSNYYSIEEFRKFRGKPISKEYTDPLTRFAIMTTSLMIEDICRIDCNAKNAFDTFSLEFQDFLRGINYNIRSH